MFHFVWPWLLILLPLPWLIHQYLKPAPRLFGQALKVPFFEMVNFFPSKRKLSVSRSSWKQWILYLIWILLLIAASGPQWLGQPIAKPHQGRDIMLAVDVSGSMQLPDMELHRQQVDRLSVVKAIASQFIEDRVGDRLGLILFGSRAYLQTPLTFDRQTVKTMLLDASIGLAGTQTAIGDAIGLSLKRLQHQGQSEKIQKNQVIVLLTDGINNTGFLNPNKASALAKELGVRIYTIGIGAEKLLVPGLFGTQAINPSADLDEKTLTSIAKATQGAYFRAKDTEGLRKAYQEIDRLEAISKEDATFRPVTPLYPWPLGLAFILILCLILVRLINYVRITR